MERGRAASGVLPLSQRWERGLGVRAYSSRVLIRKTSYGPNSDIVK
jgi:hypothetical protein